MRNTLKAGKGRQGGEEGEGASLCFLRLGFCWGRGGGKWKGIERGRSEVERERQGEVCRGFAPNSSLLGWGPPTLNVSIQSLRSNTLFFVKPCEESFVAQATNTSQCILGVV